MLGDVLVTWRDHLGVPAPKQKISEHEEDRFAILRCWDAYVAHNNYAKRHGYRQLTDQEEVALGSIFAVVSGWENADKAGRPLTGGAHKPPDERLQQFHWFFDSHWERPNLLDLLDRTPFARYIEIQRRQLGYRISSAAHLAGLSPDRWRSWEEDRARPRSEDLPAVAAALHVSRFEVEDAADGRDGLATPRLREQCICGCDVLRPNVIEYENTHPYDEPFLSVLTCRMCGEAWVQHGEDLLWIPNIGVVNAGRMPYGGTVTRPWRVLWSRDEWIEEGRPGLDKFGNHWRMPG